MNWSTSKWFTLNDLLLTGLFLVSQKSKESLAWSLENVEKIGVHYVVSDFYAEASNMPKFRV